MNIAQVFDKVADSPEYAQQPHVVDNYPHISAVLEQIENQIGREQYEAIEDSIMSLFTTYEYMGFVSGYQLAACPSVGVA